MPEEKEIQGKLNKEGGSFPDMPKEADLKKASMADKVNMLVVAVGWQTVAINKLVKSVDNAVESMNALLTTLVGQKREEFHERPELPQYPEETDGSDNATPLPEPEQEPQEMSDVEVITNSFPKYLADLLTFTEVSDEKGDFVKVKPRQFLGSENFAKIASIVRELGGDYISAGKQSHFRLYKKAE